MNGLEPDVGLDPAEKVPVYVGREQQTHGIQNPPSVNPGFVTNPGSEPSWMRDKFCDTHDANHVWTNVGRAGLLDGPHISKALPGAGVVQITRETIERAFVSLAKLGIHFPNKRR